MPLRRPLKACARQLPTAVLENQFATVILTETADESPSRSRRR